MKIINKRINNVNFFKWWSSQLDTTNKYRITQTETHNFKQFFLLFFFSFSRFQKAMIDDQQMSFICKWVG